MIFLISLTVILTITSYSLKLARLSYKGGGDWYNDPSIIPNITRFFNKNISNIFENDEAVITLTDPEIENYPVIIMTGHGNVNFSESEKNILRNYLKNGGFLIIDDDYGMDTHIRNILKNLFNNHPLVKLHNDHEIFTSFFKFEKTPKIHTHNSKPPELWGIFINQRLSLIYLFETNITDGWASPDVHKDSEEKREQALKFGSNIIFYALND